MQTQADMSDRKTIVYMETCGGLGNQLFQIFGLHAFVKAKQQSIAAAAVVKDKKTTEACVLRCDSSPSVFQNRSVYWDVLFAKVKTISKPAHIHYVHNDIDPIHGYAEIIVPTKSKEQEFWVQLKGYYQHRKHFWLWKDSLVLDLLPERAQWSNWSPLSKFLNRYNDAKSLAFLHIRRGDYKRLQQYHVVLPILYYEIALQFFPQTTKFLVFCEQEDLESVRHDFAFSSTFPHQRLIFDPELIASCPDYQQMFLMSACEAGGMMANSTFSVWAGYLHQTKTGTFTYPDKFFAHAPNNPPQIFDPTWICVSTTKETMLSHRKKTASDLRDYAKRQKLSLC